MDPDISHRQADVLGKCPSAIHADTAGVRAHVSTPGHAIAATAADYMSFAGDQLPAMEVIYIAADFDDFTDEFVADHHRYRNGFLRPLIPVVNVHVGAADCGLFGFNQDIVNTDFGFRHLLHPDALVGLRFD